jgi:acyl dehydratase
MSTLELSTTQPGTALPAISVDFTRATLVRYAGASTDFNPIHWSDRAAADLGLPGVIAHGMLTMGTALRVVTDWCGDPARVLSYYVRFTKPVVVPDDDEGATVTFGGTVTQVDDGVATVSIEALFDGVKVLGAAIAEVRVD